MPALHCFHCGLEILFKERIGLREECPKCHSDVHCCRNCQFYDPKVYNECKEPSAEVVRERERANHCEYFVVGNGMGGGGATKEDLMRAAEALFKKK